MADTIAELKVKYGGDLSGLKQATSEGRKEVSSLADAATKSSGGIGAFLKNATGGALELAKAVPGLGQMASAIGSLAGGLVSGNAQFETFQTQFSVLLKGTDSLAVGMDRAKARIADLSNFAATTPFELPEVVNAGKVLQAFGLQGEQSMKRFGLSTKDVLTVVGDAAAGSGANFSELANTFGKFAAGSTGDAIARLQELGIATKAQMQEVGIQFDKSGALITPVDEAFKKMVALVKGHMGGMMDAQSQTFDGMMSNLSDWKDGAIRQMSAPIFDVLKDNLGKLLTFLGSDQVKNTLNTVATTIASGIGGAISFLQTVVPPVVGILSNLFNNVIGKGLDIIRPALNAVLPMLTDFGTFLGKAFSGEGGRLDLLNKLPGMLQPVGRIIGDLVENVGEFIHTISGGGDPISAFGALIKNNFVDLLSDLGLDQGGVSSFVDGVVNGFQTAAGIVSDFAQKAMTFIGQVITFLQSPGVQGVLNTIKDLIVQGLGQAWTAVSGAWNAAVPAVSKMLTDLGTALKPVGDAIGIVTGLFGQGGFAGVASLVRGELGSTNPVIQALQGAFQAMQPVIEAVKNVWANLEPVFQRIAAQVMPALQQAWVNVQPAVKVLQDAFTNLQPVLQVVGEVVGFVVGTVIVGAFSLLVGAVQGIIDALPGLGTAFSGVFEFVQGVVQFFWGFISGIWSLLADLFTGRFDDMGKDFQGSWQLIVDGVTNIVTGLWDFVRGIFDAGYSFVVGLATGFWDTITGIWNGISDALVGHSIIPDMINSITGFFQGLWDGLVNIVKGIWDGITHWFTQTATDAVAKVLEMKDKALNLVGLLKDLAVEKVKNLAIDAVVHAIKFRDDIVAKALELKDKALAFVTELKDKAIQAVLDLAVGAVVHALKLKDDVTAKVLELRDAVVGKFTELKDKALGFITGLISDGVAALNGAVNTFRSAGQSIIDGLQGAISAGKDAIVNTIKNIASDSLDAIKNFFGIQSPSKETKGVGQMVMEGLSVGMSGEQDALKATVTTQMQGVLDSMNAVVDYHMDPKNTDGLAAQWYKLLGLMGTKIDQGNESLKAYAGLAFRGVIEYIQAEIQDNFPDLVQQWGDFLNQMKSLVQQWVSDVNSAFGSLVYPTPPPAGSGGGGGAPTGGYTGNTGGGGTQGGPGLNVGKLSAVYGGAGAGSGGASIIINGMYVTPPVEVAEWLVETAQRKNTNNRGVKL